MYDFVNTPEMREFLWSLEFKPIRTLGKTVTRNMYVNADRVLFTIQGGFEGICCGLILHFLFTNQKSEIRSVRKTTLHGIGYQVETVKTWEEARDTLKDYIAKVESYGM